MTIVADSREKNLYLKENVDEVRFLGYKAVGSDANYSYDILVTTEAGQDIKFERKAMPDAIQSFAEGKLDRQSLAVDALLIEWDDVELQMSPRMQDEKYRLLAANTKKHLWRVSLTMPVIWTGSVTESVAFLRYLESKTKEIPLFKADAAPKVIMAAPPPVNHLTEFWAKRNRSSHGSLWHHWRMTDGVPVLMCGRTYGSSEDSPAMKRRPAAPSRACQMCVRLAGTESARPKTWAAAPLLGGQDAGAAPDAVSFQAQGGASGSVA